MISIAFTVPAGSLSHFPNHPPIELLDRWGYQSLSLVCSSIHPPTSCCIGILSFIRATRPFPLFYLFSAGISWSLLACLLSRKIGLESHTWGWITYVDHTVYKSFNFDCIAILVSFKRSTRDSGTHSSHLLNKQ